MSLWQAKGWCVCLCACAHMCACASNRENKYIYANMCKGKCYLKWCVTLSFPDVSSHLIVNCSYHLIAQFILQAVFHWYDISLMNWLTQDRIRGLINQLQPYVNLQSVVIFTYWMNHKNISLTGPADFVSCSGTLRHIWWSLSVVWVPSISDGDGLVNNLIIVSYAACRNVQCLVNCKEPLKLPVYK